MYFTFCIWHLLKESDVCFMETLSLFFPIYSKALTEETSSMEGICWNINSDCGRLRLTFDNYYDSQLPSFPLEADV